MILKKRTIAFLSVVLLLGFSSVVYAENISSFRTLATSYVAEFGELLDRKAKTAEGKRDSAVFVGDIMLARNVERVLAERGYNHALAGSQDLFNAQAVIGNFEAAVPAVHVPTPNFTMRFSVQRSNVELLANGGVTHLSLANNHALDYGAEGYKHTIEVLNSRGMSAFGHPSNVSTSSIEFIEVGGKKMAVIAMAATFGYPSESKWRPVVESAESDSDLQVVYIHWGEEYKLVHNASQERFAHSLIDAGVDVIIGHHPHVVQDVERYGDGLIFYSLGNFIFDQYWNDDVQTGLALELWPSSKGWQIDLKPVESKTVRVQPREMVLEKRELFLQSLADRSDPALTKDLLEGTIRLQF